MGFPVSLLMYVKSLGSVIATYCGNHYSLHMSLVEVSSQRVIIDKVFLVPRCVCLARVSHHSHQVLTKVWGAVLGLRVDDLSDIWGEELLSLAKENSSDF